jgi:hypothetical protein
MSAANDRSRRGRIYSRLNRSSKAQIKAVIEDPNSGDGSK